jgi:hypothetical protein
MIIDWNIVQNVLSTVGGFGAPYFWDYAKEKKIYHEIARILQEKGLDLSKNPGNFSNLYMHTLVRFCSKLKPAEVVEFFNHEVTVVVMQTHLESTKNI